MEIQHCAAKLEYSSSLTYIVAKCNQEDLPYQFKTLEGGVFSSSSQYGSINLTHFSGLGVAYHWSSFMHMFGLTTRQPEPNTRSYCARLYYRSSGINCWEVCFAIVCNLELHIAVSISVGITIVIDNIFRLGFKHRVDNLISWLYLVPKETFCTEEAPQNEAKSSNHPTLLLYRYLYNRRCVVSVDVYYHM